MRYDYITLSLNSHMNVIIIYFGFVFFFFSALLSLNSRMNVIITYFGFVLFSLSFQLSCYSSFIKCYNPQLEVYLRYPLIPLQIDFDNLINAIPDPSRPVSLWQNVKALRMELLMSINSMQLSLIGGRRMIRRINNPAETDEESIVADERDNTDRVRDNWLEKYMRD